MLSTGPLSGAPISGQSDVTQIEVTLTDTFGLNDVFDLLQSVYLSDSASLNDTPTPALSIPMRESASLADAASANWRGARTLADTLTLAESVRLAWGKTLADTITLDESFVLQLALLLADDLTLSGAITNQHRMAQTVAETLALAETLNWGFGVELSETATLADTFAEKAKFYQSYLESASLDDTLSHTARIYITASESASLGDSLLNTLRARETMSEGVEFTVTLPGGDTYIGWVMNTETAGVSTYTNFDFNSFAVNPDGQFGAKTDGLYHLTGADDAGTNIAAILRTGTDAPGGGFMSRVPECYLGFRADGQLLLKTITGEAVERWYKLRPTTAGIHEGRIKLGKGVKSRYWQFQFENINGADFDLDAIELFPVVLSRKV